MSRTLTIAVLVVVSCLGARTVTAQRTFSGPHFGPPHPFRMNPASGPRREPAYAPGIFSYPLYDEALLDSGYPVASQPAFIVVQSMLAKDSASPAASSAAQPLLIELQGDRYVRVSGEDDSRSEMLTGEETLAQPAAAVRHEPPPAILVFRDGHQEQIIDYMIANGTLYARDTIYDAAWTRRINLSSLDLLQTVRFNQDRGLRFRLPTAPNEVMIGP